jgi:hypothetical protein
MVRSTSLVLLVVAACGGQSAARRSTFELAAGEPVAGFAARELVSTAPVVAAPAADELDLVAIPTEALEEVDPQADEHRAALFALFDAYSGR